MSRVINFGFAKAIRSSTAFMAQTRQEVEERMAELLSADISSMNGRDLRGVRDELISLQRIHAASGPAVRGFIERKVTETGSEPSSEELQECIDRMVRPIRFILA